MTYRRQVLTINTAIFLSRRPKIELAQPQNIQMSAEPTLPLDILYALIDQCDAASLNSFARSCVSMAQYVRSNLERLTNAHLKRRYACHDDYEFSVLKFPNGMRHRAATISIGQFVHVSVEYHLGEPTYWQIRNHRKTFWGCTSSPYVIECVSPIISDETCYVHAQVGEREIIEKVRGKYSPGGSDVDPLKGYLVDSRIQLDVVGRWVDKVIAALNMQTGAKVTRQQMGMFGRQQINIFRAEFGNEFDFMELVK